MKRHAKRSSTVLIVLAVSGCANAPRADGPVDPAAGRPAAEATPDQARFASRLLPCVEMQSTNEVDGLREERRWLHDHYPGWKNAGLHGLVFSGDQAHRRYFDHDDIITNQNERVTACFDITKFYGKFG